MYDEWTPTYSHMHTHTLTLTLTLTQLTLTQLTLTQHTCSLTFSHTHLFNTALKQIHVRHTTPSRFKLMLREMKPGWANYMGNGSFIGVKLNAHTSSLRKTPHWENQIPMFL